MKACPIAASVPDTDDDERLKDLLDGRLSAEELAEISDDPVLRSLAIRIYGDSVREVLGEEPIIDDILKLEDDIIEVVTVEVTTDAPIVPITPSQPLQQPKLNNNKGLFFITLGLFIIAFDLFNVLAGLGSIINTCSDIGCTPTRLKLNLLSAHQMATPLGWSEVGMFGIPDYILLAIGALVLLMGLRKVKKNA